MPRRKEPPRHQSRVNINLTLVCRRTEITRCRPKESASVIEEPPETREREIMQAAQFWEGAHTKAQRASEAGADEEEDAE